MGTSKLDTTGFPKISSQTEEFIDSSTVEGFQKTVQRSLENIKSKINELLSFGEDPKVKSVLDFFEEYKKNIEELISFVQNHTKEEISKYLLEHGFLDEGEVFQNL